MTSCTLAGLSPLFDLKEVTPMSDDRQVPRRRRRPPVAPAPQEPMRIIVGNEQDTPDWMVSDTSGAASRRTKKKAEPSPRAEAARPSTRGTQERVVRGAQ